MGRLILAVAVVWVGLLIGDVRHGDLTGWQAAASLIKPTALVLLALAAWAALRGLQRLWRASRRVKVETVAETAGALTAAAQARAASVKAAFKDGASR